MPIPENLVDYIIQLSNYGEFVRDTDGSPIIPASKIINSERNPFIVDIDYDVTIFEAFKQADGLPLLSLTLNPASVSGDFQYGELIIQSPDKIAKVISWKPESNLLIVKPTQKIISSGGILGEESGAIGTVTSVIESLFYEVAKIPMVRSSDVVPRYKEDTDYSTGDIVKHTYKDPKVDLIKNKRKNQVMTSKGFVSTRGSLETPEKYRIQQKVYESLAANGPSTSLVEPGSNSAVWKELGTDLTIKSKLDSIQPGTSRALSFQANSGTSSAKDFSYNIILDSSEEPSDVNEVSVIVNDSAVSVSSVSGHTGIVTIDRSSAVIVETDEVVGIGDGTTKQFSVKYPGIVDKADPEVVSITTVADVSGSLDGKYFVLYDENGSVAFWFDHGDSGTPEPAHGADRSVEITTVSNDDADSVVATKIASVIDSDSQFYASSTGNTVTVTYATTGNKPDASAGDSGFTVTVSSQGSDSTGVLSSSPSDIIVKVGGTSATVSSIDDPVKGLFTLSSAPSAGEIVTVTYTRLPNFSAGDNVIVSYYHNKVIEWTGDEEGPVLDSLDYDFNTKTLTINRDSSSSVGFITGATPLDPTRVFVWAPKFRENREQIHELRHFNIVNDDTIEVPNMGDLEKNNQIRIWVLVRSKKSNSLYYNFPDC